MSEESLWTISDVAEYLRITEKAVRNRIDRNEIPFVRIGKATIRFRPEEIKALLKEEGARG